MVNHPNRGRNQRLDISVGERAAIEIAMRQYLSGFTVKEVAAAPDGSNIGHCRALLDRVMKMRRA